MRRALVITISDRSSAGEQKDESGPAVAEQLTTAGFEVGEPMVVADDRTEITAVLRSAVKDGYSLIVTTGGTGLAARDVTPEATLEVIDKEVPGLAELMRATGLEKTPMAALSRAVAGTIGQSLILNLPGSPKGATESLDAVLGILGHALDVLQSSSAH
ncbi:MAG: molybdopterin adenylyltransferase [Actinomycetota bacterium]|nr:molybdopterin adenylyltransferase [Actinomycetota bacterium]